MEKHDDCSNPYFFIGIMTRVSPKPIFLSKTNEKPSYNTPAGPTRASDERRFQLLVHGMQSPPSAIARAQGCDPPYCTWLCIVIHVRISSYMIIVYHMLLWLVLARALALALVLVRVLGGGGVSSSMLILLLLPYYVDYFYSSSYWS